jgi:hypothetical protein
MKEVDYESIENQLREIWQLSKHMTPAEKTVLAESLDSFPYGVLEGFGGVHLEQMRWVIQGRLLGNGSEFEDFLNLMEGESAKQGKPFKSVDERFGL